MQIEKIKEKITTIELPGDMLQMIKNELHEIEVGIEIMEMVQKEAHQTQRQKEEPLSVILDRRIIKQVLGKKAVCDIDGVIQKGETITEQTIDLAKQHQKILELSMNYETEED